MADELLDKVRDVVEGEILLSLNIGYAKQDIVLAMYIGLAGTALTFLVVVPPWPFFKRNPVKWLPAGYGTTTL
ncbi:hypothetical protein GMORB2_3086 [Geosmithia morbida]|uniref:Signal peptidase complex subunit 1 n=1 Tax=Geosmithia morbida TaxID=1094350 RepID=A0A9P4YPE6_9HYPO|nr:uncharacterized protein GMORB2_3086 [Geosmithia morbida]KAF4120285.1 hypothetical protein GMORB2_3086 [Geosmithia morbida]